MKFIKIAAALILIIACFCACSNVPDEPAVTSSKDFTYKNAFGETVPVAENIGNYPGLTQPVKYIETVQNVECNFKSYYVYGNTVATIETLEFENIDMPATNVYAIAKVKMIAAGREDQMKIDYKAYDENGKCIKANGCLTRNIDGIEDGEIFDMVFLAPIGTARVEFFDCAE